VHSYRHLPVLPSPPKERKELWLQRTLLQSCEHLEIIPEGQVPSDKKFKVANTSSFL
jgi:hypothetical protein